MKFDARRVRGRRVLSTWSKEAETRFLPRVSLPARPCAQMSRRVTSEFELYLLLSGLNLKCASAA
jgi:hypothetical protein